MRELFHEITSNLRNNKLRTALTGFAVSWGIFLLICLLGAGNGLMNSFMGNISDYISQNITVEGWRTSKPYAGYKEGRVIQLDETDVTWTEGPRWEPTVGNVTRQTETTGVTFSLDGNTVAGQISGVLPEYQEQNKIKMYAGRFLNPDDLKERRKVVVLSLAQAKELSPKDPEALVGKWVGAGTVSFRVVGIYHTDESDMYRTCPIPYSTYKGIYDTSDKIGSITFTVDGPETKEEYEAFEKGYGSATPGWPRIWRSLGWISKSPTRFLILNRKMEGWFMPRAFMSPLANAILHSKRSWTGQSCARRCSIPTRA